MGLATVYCYAHVQVSNSCGSLYVGLQQPLQCSVQLVHSLMQPHSLMAHVRLFVFVIAVMVECNTFIVISSSIHSPSYALQW
jgi:hypothetical protein